MPIHYESIPADAMTKQTQKVTTGFFPGGIGTVTSGSFTTSSLASSQKNYYIPAY